MNLLNINLIRKKSQEFYKIIPEFYQSAPCMIVRRVLVFYTSRLGFASPKTSTRPFSTHPLNRLVAYTLVGYKDAEVCR